MNGRKRFVAVDSLGLIWAVLVTTADTQDRDGGCWLLQAVRGRLARLREVIADGGLSKRVVGGGRYGREFGGRGLEVLCLHLRLGERVRLCLCLRLCLLVEGDLLELGEGGRSGRELVHELGRRGDLARLRTTRAVVRHCASRRHRERVLTTSGLGPREPPAASLRRMASSSFLSLAFSSSVRRTRSSRSARYCALRAR